jgi:uncharacterized protein (DUF488 family)
MVTVHTVGHGTLSSDEFAALIERAQVDGVVDVRSFPGSRHNPQFGREEMERWVPKAGIGYVWIRDLGGRRQTTPGSKHVALRNDSFRAYADHMETHAFLSGIESLLVLAESDSPTVMCSESLWWRCHRRLIADYLVLVRGINVVHLMHDGRSTPHVLTEGVRLAQDALVYDVGVTPPLAMN